MVSAAAFYDPREWQHWLHISQQIFLYPLKVALISVKFVSGKSTCLSDFGSAREAGGHRLLSYILLLVRPEVQMLGGEFIPSIRR